MLADSDQFLTFEQLREKLAMSDPFLRREVRSGKLRAYRFGKVLRFDPADVRAYTEARRIEQPSTADPAVQPELVQPQRRRPAARRRSKAVV